MMMDKSVVDADTLLREDRWLLPEGIEELLPPRARRLEALRRSLLDCYASWGYELVIPPQIEFLDSLLVGTGSDLDLQTFKLTDQITGRLMGLRADMTPQVARIDAHSLRREGPVRLCYMGTVVHTRPAGFVGSRTPLQIGAELYGHAGIESDLEIICLMVRTLEVAGVGPLHLDLGHVGIFRSLARSAGLDAVAESDLFDALQRKAVPEIERLLAVVPAERPARAGLLALAQLNGGADILAQAQQLLQGCGDEVLAALSSLQRLSALVAARLPQVTLHLDLAELRGYRYHTGIVFAAFVPGRGQSVAQGGRYDGIGRVFGKDRPATGFSSDLKSLLLFAEEGDDSMGGVFAPDDDDGELWRQIEQLRGSGERVVVALPGQQGGAREAGCDRRLVKGDSGWSVVELMEQGR